MIPVRERGREKRDQQIEACMMRPVGVVWERSERGGEGQHLRYVMRVYQTPQGRPADAKMALHNARPNKSAIVI